MLTLLLIIIFAIIVGAVTGLLPALPVYTAPFILYYFGHDLPLEYLMIFWLVAVSGSQFFGSISTITTKIPGEESSTIYLNDIDKLSLNQRNSLLYDTALGSFVAGILSLGFVYLALSYIKSTGILIFSSMNFQISCYTLAILSFWLFSKNLFSTIGLILLGLFLGPKNNYALPSAWYDIHSIFSGFTFYMIVLGTVIIPELFLNRVEPESSDVKATNNKTFSILQGIKSSIIGIFTGLIPGPSAFLAALTAYKTAGKDLYKKIVAAETANNASVITCTLPLLLLGLPINQNTLLFSNLMDIRSIEITEKIFQTSIVPEFNIIQLVLLCSALSLSIYFWLSTHLIWLYTKFIESMHNKMKYIMFLIVGALVSLDIHNSDVTIYNYVTLLSVFSLMGFVLKKYKISPMPFLFSLILGDKIVWLYIQFFKINF